MVVIFSASTWFCVGKVNARVRTDHSNRLQKQCLAKPCLANEGSTLRKYKSAFPLLKAFSYSFDAKLSFQTKKKKPAFPLFNTETYFFSILSVKGSTLLNVTQHIWVHIYIYLFFFLLVFIALCTWTSIVRLCLLFNSKFFMKLVHLFLI